MTETKPRKVEEYEQSLQQTKKNKETTKKANYRFEKRKRRRKRRLTSRRTEKKETESFKGPDAGGVLTAVKAMKRNEENLCKDENGNS